MADDPPDEAHASRWTLGQVRALNLQLEARCRAPGCNWFCTFDLDRLIADFGPEHALPAGDPALPCQRCGGELKFEFAYLHADNDNDGPPHAGPEPQGSA